MMSRSLYAKIILILVIFIITVMSVVGTVLLNSVYRFYTEDFVTQMEQSFAVDGQLYSALVSAVGEEEYVSSLKAVLHSYSAWLGIDSYRNYYILDGDGVMLDGSDETLGQTLRKTPKHGRRDERQPGQRTVKRHRLYRLCCSPLWGRQQLHYLCQGLPEVCSN